MASDQISSFALLGIFLAWSACFVPLLLKLKVFSLPLLQKEPQDPNAKIGFLNVAFALFLYIALSAFAMLALSKFFSFKFFSLSYFQALSLAQMGTFILSCGGLIGFSKILRDGTQSKIWGKISAKPLLKGALLSIACYPVVMLLVEVIQLGVDEFFHLERADQLAVAHLKNLRPYPWLFGSFIFTAIVVVPVLEELLFRGFFQNFFVALFGPKAGIPAASLVFTGFHYSSQQGATNIEMTVGLFILGYLIGVTYLKEKSLFAAIGMHSAFNALGVLFIILIKETS